MLVSGLFALAASLFAVASANEDKHKPCGGCRTRDEAERAVTAAFDQLVAATRRCDYKKSLESFTRDASYVTVESYCEPCCVEIGSAQRWFDFYTCESQLDYPLESRSFHHLSNGTVILSTLEATSFAYTNDISLYNVNYYWFPVEGKCEFLVGYIDGWVPRCPAFVPGALNCNDCATL